MPTLASTPSISTSPAAQPAVASCRADQLQIAVSGGGPAETQQGIAWKITARAHQCTLQGWPQVLGHSAAGSTPARRTTQSAALLSRRAHIGKIVVSPDNPAYVLLDGVDYDISSGQGCGDGTYRHYKFTLPDDGGSLSTRIPESMRSNLTMCGIFGSTPFIRANDVIPNQR